jgi:hypothetical protein
MAIDWFQWWDRLPYVGAKGEEILPRIIPLNLDMLTIRVRSRRQEKCQPPPETWKDLNNYPLELLREIDRYLQRVNTERISSSKRREWVAHALQYACPAMRKIYSEHYKSDALPESHDRREGLVAAINVCVQLAFAYKRQLNEDFALSDGGYARVRSRVREHALRVLEFIRMEQRLRAMRYQKLPEKNWQDCNHLFFAVSQCEDVDEPQTALGCLQVMLDSPTNEAERRAPSMTSINLMYLSIQMHGLFDITTMSSPKLHVVDAQISTVLHSITIIPDHGKPLGRGKLLVYYGQGCPPYFRRQDEAQRSKQADWLKARGNSTVAGLSLVEEDLKALIIDVAPMDALLTKEHQKMLQRFETKDVLKEAEEKHANSKYNTVADQDDLANLLTIDAMCDGLRLKQRVEKREYIIGQKVLYVYNGFMSVYKLLVDMVAEVEEEEINPELAADNELRDALAGHSALIAADMEASEFGRWFVVDKSEGGVHIKTRESEFTTALFIGQVVAFAYSREELVKPVLGYVVRLRRSMNAEIEVTIRILSKSVVATAVQSEFLSKNDMALPAIILEGDRNSGRRLMLHHSHRLSSGTTVKIELDQKQSDIVSEMLKIQREFVLYSLQG